MSRVQICPPDWPLGRRNELRCATRRQMDQGALGDFDSLCHSLPWWREQKAIEQLTMLGIYSRRPGLLHRVHQGSEVKQRTIAVPRESLVGDRMARRFTKAGQPMQRSTHLVTRPSRIPTPRCNVRDRGSCTPLCWNKW